MNKNKLPRKLKKKIIKVFGRGTYQGISEGILTIKRYNKNKGCIITYTFNKEKEKNIIKRESVINKGINFKFIIL